MAHISAEVYPAHALQISRYNEKQSSMNGSNENEGSNRDKIDENSLLTSYGTRRALRGARMLSYLDRRA